MTSYSGRRAALLAAALGLASLPACGKKVESPPPAVFGQTVRGSVVYKGEPVQYGCVLFYSHGRRIDHNTGEAVPTAFAAIRDGKYEATNVPAGPVDVYVATDPDVDLTAMTRPTMPGGMSPPGGPQGGGPAPPHGAPMPPHGAPPHGAPMPPHGAPMPVPGPAPKTFTDAQKKTLKEIHEKFGKYGTARLNYVVREGEQTYDPPLK